MMFDMTISLGAVLQTVAMLGGIAIFIWRLQIRLEIVDTKQAVAIEKISKIELELDKLTAVTIEQAKQNTRIDHVSYIGSRPYQIWYLIYDAEICVGQVYLSKNNELGVQIFKEFQNRGYGQMALNFMIETYKSINLLANINPKNEKSIKLFEKLGFKHIQNTYKRDATARPSSLSPT